MWSIIVCMVLLAFVIIISFNRPYSIMFFYTNSLPMYFATKYTLELLGRENTKENRKYVKSMCCSGTKFSEEFLEYSKATFCSMTLPSMGQTMYDYITFKEKAKEVHQNEST